MLQSNQKTKRNIARNLAWPLFMASIIVSIAGLIAAIYIITDCAEKYRPGTELIVSLGSQLASFLIGLLALAYGIASSHNRTGPFIRFVINVFIIFFVIFIWIPNFLRFNGHACQSEAKQNLGAIYTAYTSYHNDNNTYPSSPFINFQGNMFNCLAISDWEPKGRIGYNYNCMNTEVFSPGPYAPDYPCPPGIVTTATKDSFTVATCKNIDKDATIDVWTIDDAKHLRNVINDIKN